MKKILSLLLTLALCMGLGVPALAAGFPDVPPGHYAAAAIDACVEKGIASGFADGTFRPAAPVTRAQFCAMIARAFFPEELAYYDTDEYRAKSWFAPAVMALFCQGPYGGVLTSVSFAPNEEYPLDSAMSQPINRYDMAHIAAEVLRANSIETPSSDQVQSKIGDWSQIPVLERYDVADCYSLGILGGQKDGTFGGNNTMNRAQTCAVIDRLARRLAGDTPAVSQPSAQPSAPSASSGLPEIRCYGSGYLMRPAGGTVLDLNNGGSSSGFYNMCDLCRRFYLCQQCSQHYADASLLMRRHEAVCASGGGVAPMEDFCSPYYRDSVYHQRLKSVTLTGNYRQDILAVAASQIGYEEGNNSTQLDGSYGGRGNYSEYNWVFGEDAVRITVIDGNSDSTVRRHDYTYYVNQGLKGYFVSPNY